ncbi:phage protein [Thiobacillus denitrificans]|uniref:Phage protein n=1 Tax=Thiobacillus denitrificans TaxID=36861 RepID=A0A106BQ08_THIDE|nr:phage protein [Thiobacillus denitrificans]
MNDTFTLPVTQGPAAAAGIAYDVLRYTTVDGTLSGHELIMKAKGLDGLQEIYWGIRTYHDVGADYYNLLAGVFTGYIAGNTFDTQPGAALVGCPAHNNRIDYWLTMNGQRIALAMKVGTPVYEHLYLGKMLPYSRPSQFPYPVVAGGMLVGAAATRFSEITHDFYLRGASARGQLRTPGGYVNMYCYPWGNTYITGNSSAAAQLQARDTEGQYPLLPVELHDNSANLYGQLDGIFHVSGFNSAVENTLVIGGVTYVVMQSVARTGHADYYALRLDV